MKTVATLKERCRAILDIYPLENRHASKIQLRAWIQNPRVNITFPDVDTLDQDELGIFMNSGAYGNLYSYANARAGVLKGRPRPPSEKQETGGNTLQNATPLVDEKRGFEQFTIEQIRSLTARSDDEEICGMARLFAKEIINRGLTEVQTRP